MTFLMNQSVTKAISKGEHRVVCCVHTTILIGMTFTISPFEIL